MSKRVTNFRIDTFEITEEDFYTLPATTQQLIRTYGSPKRTERHDLFRFEIPAYRWEEIEQSMKVLP